MGTLYLGLTILCTAWIMIGLRELKRWNIPLLQAITINYVAASATGLIQSPNAVANVAADPGALALGTYLGLAFITLFFLMGTVAQNVGVGYMTVVTKMSLVLPTLFAWLYYGEEMTWLKGGGILVALVSVFLINYRPDDPVKLSSKEGNRGLWLNALLVVVLFVGSGINDTGFKIFNEEFSGTISQVDFPVVIFGLSAVIGIVISTFQIVTGRVAFTYRSLIGGLLIGIPNYFSIVFLVRSLEYLDGTFFFPVNNIALLVVTGVVGVFVYKEKLNYWNLAGFLMAIGAVLLLV